MKNPKKIESISSLVTFDNAIKRFNVITFMFNKRQGNKLILDKNTKNTLSIFAQEASKLGVFIGFNTLDKIITLGIHKCNPKANNFKFTFSKHNIIRFIEATEELHFVLSKSIQDKGITPHNSRVIQPHSNEPDRESVTNNQNLLICRQNELSFSKKDINCSSCDYHKNCVIFDKIK